MNVVRTLGSQLLMAAALVMSGAGSHAQPATSAQPSAGASSTAQPAGKGPPNALQGFSQNRNEPVHIESATLEVRDKDKVATFSGDVKVTQGDTIMRCKSLLVFYEQDADKGDKTDKSKKLAKTETPGAGKPLQAAEPGPGGQQNIKRLEAHGGVVVTQKDQIATGNQGVFDVKSNTVTLIGNVVMTQGTNVLRGEKLIVDLTTSVSRVESGKNGGGRVQGLFTPGSAGPEMPKPGAAPAQRPATAPAAPVPARPPN
jgi:lipopolysaccharide export system protein LptA